MSGCPQVPPGYLRPVLKDARGWCLRGVRFLRRASASAAAAARARRAIGRAFSAFVCGVTRVPPPLGVRCALFSVFVGVGRVSSALIKLTCFSVGLRLRASPSGFAFGLSPSGFAFGLRLRASPSGFAFGLRLRASPSGPPDATTRRRTRGWCLWWFAHAPQNTHGTPRSYLRRNDAAVRCVGGLPAAFAAIDLAHTRRAAVLR